MTDLTTIESVKQYLQITNTNDDEFLAALISNVSKFIETYLSRVISSASYTEYLNGVGYNAQAMALSNTPITAVQSISVDGVSITASVGFGKPGYNFDDSFIYLTGYGFSKGARNVQVTYTAGYATTPLDIVQAANQLVAWRYKEIQRIGQDSKTLNNETTTYSTEAMPKDVKIILERYRKKVPV
jgi:hypothetical protein